MNKKEDSVFFGKVNFRGRDEVFGIRPKDRRQHFYIVGKTGTGKSSLISNLILQDIIAGRGICLVDPHGELVENVIPKIPKERIKDVVYFNPSDMDYPMGFNVLEVYDPKYKHLIASDLMGIFTKIWSNVWSARMEYILNNCVLALLDTPGTTLLGITRILVDKDYRQKIISNIQDPVVKAFWIHEYEGWREQFRNEAIVPIQNKVGQFLSTPLIRNIVGQEKSSLNVKDIMDNEKILLINVSKGRVGEDNSALLGAMVITKIQLAVMERVRIEESERKDFYLYIDEFQNFVTDSFASILSEARKYGLNLIIAHQYIGQLMLEASTKVRDAIFGNVGTMVSFRVGATDAEYLEKEFTPEFVIQDLVNLPNYNIYLKLMVDGVTSRPFSASTLPPFSVASHDDNEKEILELSRRLYGRPREKVEADIAEWSGMAPARTSSFERRSPEESLRGERGLERGGERGGERGREPKRVGGEKPAPKFAPHLGAIGIEFEQFTPKPSVSSNVQNQNKPAPKNFTPRPVPKFEPKGAPKIIGEDTSEFLSLKNLMDKKDSAPDPANDTENRSKE